MTALGLGATLRILKTVYNSTVTGACIAIGY